jgi:alpha-L-fucosidase
MISNCLCKHFLLSGLGTRAGAIPPTPGMVSTRKGDIHYVHVFDYTSDCVTLTSVPESITGRRLLCDDTEVEIERHEDKWLLYSPESQRDMNDTVIMLS